jgi:cell division protein ZapA
MDDIFLINVHIGGFRMPLRIPRSDEEIYRKAEKLVVKYTDEYQRLFNQRTYEEILRLVAFQLAVNISRNELSEDITPLADKIKLLEKELDSVLNQE